MIFLGLRFALMELKLVLASIMSEFKFIETEHTPETLEVDPAKFNLCVLKPGAKLGVKEHHIKVAHVSVL